MFPELTRWEKFLRKKEPEVYGNIEHTFYAIHIDSQDIPRRSNIWSESKIGEKICGPADYLYFVIYTSVGVGAKGKINKLDRVHVRFHLMPMKAYLHEPEIISIYPSV